MTVPPESLGERTAQRGPRRGFVEIGGRRVGPAYPPYLIAEVGSNHDGDLDRALALINCSADAGADAVKFQNFVPEKICVRSDPSFPVYERTCVPLEWTPALAKRCEAQGVAYLSTAFDPETLDALDPYVSAHKIASGDVTYHALIARARSKSKPILLSTGASDWVDVHEAMGVLRDWDDSTVMMQCCSDYEGVGTLGCQNLLVIERWRRLYAGTLFGFSDHTRGDVAACAAVALGAVVIEKHITDTPGSDAGPDHAFALEPSEFFLMAKRVRRTWETLGSPLKRVGTSEKASFYAARRSLRWDRHLPKGSKVRSAYLSAVRPYVKGSLDPRDLKLFESKVLRRDVRPEQLASREDVEEFRS